MEEKLKQTAVNIVKVVLFGPESSGKTTLSKLLARHYNTVWVPEYARDYLQNKWNNERKTCEISDMLPIAEGQIKSENRLAKKADRILICDTDLLETKVYSEEFYEGFVHPELEKAAVQNTYDLYLLTYIDAPWKKDDLRYRPELRPQMFNAFENALIKNQRSYILLKGTKNERFETAVREIDEILKSKSDLYRFLGK